jgi:hypothetical protein
MWRVDSGVSLATPAEPPHEGKPLIDTSTGTSMRDVKFPHAHLAVEHLFDLFDPYETKVLCSKSGNKFRTSERTSKLGFEVDSSLGARSAQSLWTEATGIVSPNSAGHRRTPTSLKPVQKTKSSILIWFPGLRSS